MGLKVYEIVRDGTLGRFQLTEQDAKRMGAQEVTAAPVEPAENHEDRKAHAPATKARRAAHTAVEVENK